MAWYNSVVHAVGNVAAPVLEAGGAVASPVLGSNNSLTQAGHNISNQGVTLSNPAGIVQSNDPAFSGSGAYGNTGGSSTNKAASGSSQSPNAGTTTSTVGGSGGSGGVDTAGLAAYLADIQTQLDALNATQNTGQNQIGAQYNTGLNNLNQSQSQALSKLSTQKSDTTADEQTSLDKINTDTRNNYNSLMNLLGLAGAGSSSAAQVLAPYAVSQLATQQRGGVVTDYGRNLRDIDTAVGDANTQYQQNLNDLNQKKTDALNNLINGVQTQRATLLSNQAQAQNASGAQLTNFQNQLNSIRQQIASLGNVDPNAVSVTPVSVTTPTLQAYTVDANGVTTANNAAANGSGHGTTDDTTYDPSQYFPELAKQQQDQQQQGY